ncbi:MAG: YebC/PmpR family DNA-binding transcriptional regulator [Chloroflexi bacterium]|nr:MAG: YebC/PmpR family DNA-binding transcriptional regulator [Chloroflexota bacterium]TME42044.1 MAG: YebC/PmpR family DNA-binding transcriptional regulator [Chloroflexota bacterium]
MSGHSKWAGIKHKKAIVDAKRGQAFTRASREITISAREGGGNPDSNFRLRLAIQKARDMNMPTDKIKNAIERGTGEFAGERLEEVRYEGYGPAGVAVMADALTDNRNRTSASIRHRFSKLGGNLAESNAVGWMFERKGVITVNAGKHDPEEVGLAAIEAGADDVQVDGKSVEITTPPGVFEKVKAALEALGVSVENAEITMQPKQTVAVGEDKAAAVLRLMESLEEDDDVQQVYANFDIPSDVLERVSAQV